MLAVAVAVQWNLRIKKRSKRSPVRGNSATVQYSILLTLPSARLEM